MKRSICSLVFATLLCLAGARSADAQLGPILDWIHKLSGPGVMQAGLTYSAPLWTSPTGQVAARLRFSGMFGAAIDKSEEVLPPGGDIFLGTGRVIFELDLAGGVVSPGAGVMAHVFFGDVDTFVKPAFIPARLLLHPLKKQPVLNGLTLGFNLYYYPKWGIDDFQPLVVMVERNSGEVTWGLLLAYEFEI